MKFRQLITGVVLSVGLLIGTTPAMAAQSFTPSQKKQIQKIVYDYLIKNPQVLIEVSKVLQERQQKSMMKQAANAIDENADKLFNDSSPVLGNAKGNVTVIEFFDYQCIHCKEMSPVISKLIKKDKNLRVILKEFPIFGKSSVFAARAALAAKEQGKYKEMHEALLKKKQRLSEALVMKTADDLGINTTKLKTDMKSDGVNQALQSSNKLASVLQLRGTPAFIIANTPNGKYKSGTKPYFVPGAVSEQQLQTLIDKASK